MQKRLLRKLLADVVTRFESNGQGALSLPESAPFSPGQRAHINELLARLGSDRAKG